MITPLDIENKKFSKQMMNGYNVEEVDEFLDQIMQDYETNYKELALTKSKIDELKEDGTMQALADKYSLTLAD